MGINKKLERILKKELKYTEIETTVTGFVVRRVLNKFSCMSNWLSVSLINTYICELGYKIGCVNFDKNKLEVYFWSVD